MTRAGLSLAALRRRRHLGHHAHLAYCGAPFRHPPAEHGVALTMRSHAPYTPEEWEADEARKHHRDPLSCPDCGFFGDCRVYGSRERDDGFRYRMCKACGFWQPADGKSPPVRCWRSRHRCAGTVAAPAVCEHCGEELRPPSHEHDCGWYLLPHEYGYVCRTCGEWQDRSTRVPWTRPGSG